MVTRSLVVLIDEAILPALLLVFGKTGGIFIANIVYGLAPRFFFKGPLPQFVYPTSKDFQLVNSFSNIVMFGTVALGVVLLVVRAHFLHESHISPLLSARLLKLRLSSWTADSFRLYHQAAVWLAFLWMSTAILILQAYDGVSSSILAIAAFLLALNLSWFFILDIEKEIDLYRKAGEA